MIQTLRLISALAALAACAGGSQGASSAPAPSPAGPAGTPSAAAPLPVSLSSDSSGSLASNPPEWLVVDSAAKVVTLTLEVTAPPESPSALINGYRAGQVEVIVPRDWTVKWNWRSADTTAVHSLVVMVEREKIPLEGGRPSFSNAMTRSVTEGLRVGQTDQTSFVADEAGWYWLLCGVPSHALKGEWIELQVDPGAPMASVDEKR